MSKASTDVNMNNVRGKNTKRSHLSKNKKKSWRKVDITQVEEFLEDERLQERTGGKVSEKKDEALFMLDNRKSEKKVQERERVLDRKRKAQDRLADVEMTLQPPPPAKKDKRQKAFVEKLAQRGLPQKMIVAEKQRKASRINSIRRARERPRTTAPDYDLWADDCKLDKETANQDDHFLTVTKKRRVKVPKHHKIKPSLLPAVEVPHPGASYNPAYDEYQDLLEVANSVEEKKLRLQQRIQRALSSKLPTVQEAQAIRMKEESSGLFDDSESDDESEVSDADDNTEDVDRLSVNPPVSRENKKDEKKRKKQKLREEAEKKLKEGKLQRIRDNEIYRLKSIRKEIKEQEEKTNQRIKKREEEKYQGLFKTKRLGKRKFEEPDLEIKLTDELVGTLREVKPERDLLEDRLKSLQKRNILEPRVRVKKQKSRKIKYVEKRGHKAIKFVEKFNIFDD